MSKHAYLASIALLAVGCARANATEAIDAKPDASTPMVTLTSAALVTGASEANAKLARTKTADEESCPEGMILVEGEYCPNVEQKCLEWKDPPGRYHEFRCAKYAKPAVCKGKRVHKRFCIDATERTEETSDLPMHFKSWTDAKKICEADDARLCMASEWQFACEGEEMRPYPYGWERDSEVCNADIMKGLGKVGRLVDHRTPASAHPQCVSAFGAHDMAGNVDEWTTVDGAPPGTREVMHGSWWMPGRNACRSFQGGHGANYGGAETGVRCCKDAPSHEVATNGM